MEEVGRRRIQSQEVTVGCDIDMRKSMGWNMIRKSHREGHLQREVELGRRKEGRVMSLVRAGEGKY